MQGFFLPSPAEVKRFKNQYDLHCQQPFCPNGKKKKNKLEKTHLFDSLILSCLLIILLLGHVLLAGKVHIHNIIQALIEKDYCPVENRLGEEAYPPYFGQTNNP